MVPRDLNIGFQGLALIQGQIYNPVLGEKNMKPEQSPPQNENKGIIFHPLPCLSSSPPPHPKMIYSIVYSI